MNATVSPPTFHDRAKSLSFGALKFVAARWVPIVAISAILLVPCFWHRHIEAGDLASHTYNAWMAQLIAHGQAPGLWLARQWNNVLFDITLGGLGSLFG